MRFETAQVLEIANLSKDTLRHWKKVLGPIRRVDGRSANYSLSDLVAICVVARATQDLGVAISQIAKSADWLFAEAETRLSAPHRESIVYLLPDGTGLWTHRVPTEIEAAITIRVAPILERIRLAPQVSELSNEQLLLPLDSG